VSELSASFKTPDGASSTNGELRIRAPDSPLCGLSFHHDVSVAVDDGTSLLNVPGRVFLAGVPGVNLAVLACLY
jgi:hypothetical protein